MPDALINKAYHLVALIHWIGLHTMDGMLSVIAMNSRNQKGYNQWTHIVEDDAMEIGWQHQLKRTWHWFCVLCFVYLPKGREFDMAG